MQPRLVILRIDDIVSMLADYCGYDDIPYESKAVNLQFNPAEHGKLSIIIEADSLPSTDPLEIKFDLRRTFIL